jgi:hypothetical protein
MLQNTQTKQQKSENEEKKFYRIGYWRQKGTTTELWDTACIVILGNS